MKEVQVLPTELSQNLDLIYQAIEDNSLSTNTKLAYKRDYAHFNIFSKGEFSIDIIKGYLFALASKGFKWGTITRRLSSIEHYHTIDKLELNKFVRGLKNTLHQNNHSQVLPKQANPISKELLLERILSLPPTRKAIRDKTILLFGWVGALRVSEIAAIKLEDIERTNEGLVLNNYHSKNIKSGSKQQKFYPYSSNVNLCPVRAIEAYIREFAPGEGILFTQFRKGDVQLLKPITRASYTGIS